MITSTAAKLFSLGCIVASKGAKEFISNFLTRKKLAFTFLIIALTLPKRNKKP